MSRVLLALRAIDRALWGDAAWPAFVAWGVVTCGLVLIARAIGGAW